MRGLTREHPGKPLYCAALCNAKVPRTGRIAHRTDAARPRRRRGRTRGAIGITVRGGTGGVRGQGAYNFGHSCRHFVVMSRTRFERLRRASASDCPPERRRGPDRRSAVLRALWYGNVRPRRMGPRRAGENRIGAVDWHHPWWLAVGVLIVALSCVDAALTLLLIGRGAYEVNPLLAPLVRGTGAAFITLKVALTGGGIVCLTMLSRLKAFGWLPVKLILYGVLLGYVGLIFYELVLLGAL